MNPKRLVLVGAAICSLLTGVNTTQAQGTKFTYQGRLNDAGAPANGTYDLTFSLFNVSVGGLAVAGPLTNSPVVVSNGLFTVAVDFGAGVFNGTSYWLQIGTRTNGGGIFTDLTPRQELTPTPYAIYAETAPIADNSVTSAKILDGTITSADILNGTISSLDLAANSVNSGHIIDGQVQNADLGNDAVTSAKILDGTIVGADMANNTVTSVQLADSIDLGTTNVSGLLNVYRTTTNTPAISLFGSSSQLSTYGSDGQEQIRLWGTSYGELLLWDNSPTNHLTVTLSANGTAGGYLNLRQGNSTSSGVLMYGDNLGGGRFLGYNSSNTVSLDLRAQFDSATPAAWAGFYDGSERVTIAARSGTSGRGGLIDVKNDSSLNTIRLIGDTGANDSRLEMYAGGTNLSFIIYADDSASGSAAYLYDGTGHTRMEIDSDDGDDGAVIRMYGADNGLGIYLDAENSSAGYVAVYGTNGIANIILDGRDTGGHGRITTDELRTTGNVGIGITTPTNKLHVIGGVTFSSGSAGANQNVVWIPGSASWSFTSDRNTKDRFVAVNQCDILEKVCGLSIAEWSYIGYEQRHIGPMAQDFHAQFPLNASDTSLNDADLHGVALAAIQGLNQKVEVGNQRSEEKIQKLEAENAELKLRLEKLEQQMSGKNGGAK